MKVRVLLRKAARGAGFARPGTLTAILGASGSGKSSLLNVLAHRVPFSQGAKLTGDLQINGEAASADETAAEATSPLVRLLER